MALEADIDDLYKKPLSEFTAARNVLAKSLSGDAAKRVKSLAKPTVVPWAVNQLYWHARPAYTKLMAAGEALREAQIAALAGKAAKVSKAAEAHRTALAAAVHEAVRLASAGDAHPEAEAIGRTLEALSLAAERSSSPGRLTEAVAPAGFEALAGMKVSAPAPTAKASARAEKEKEAAAEARRRELEREVAAAERDLQRAQEAETSARDRLERATEERRRAESALATLRDQLD